MTDEATPERTSRTLHKRGADGVACAEVLDRLRAADLARRAGIDPRHPALDRLRWWARQHAAAHGYGVELDREDR